MQLLVILFCLASLACCWVAMVRARDKRRDNYFWCALHDIVLTQEAAARMKHIMATGGARLKFKLKLLPMREDPE